MEQSTETTRWHAKDTALYQGVVLAKLQALHRKTQEFASRFQARGNLRTNPLYVDRLGTIFLPTLEENINQLSEILFSTYHRKEEPDQLFQAALGALLQTEKTIHDLKSFNSTLWKSEAPRPNAQDLTLFRGGLTEKELASLWTDLQTLFRVYAESFPLCGVFSLINVRNVNPLNILVLESASRSTKKGINTLIQWLDMSDFKVLQNSWQPIVQKASQVLCDLTLSRDKYRDRPSLQETFSDCIVVVKLMRVFMKKLTKPNNRELSQMPPNEHAALLNATAPISDGLRSLAGCLDNYIGRPHQFQPKPAAPLADALNNTCSILQNYFGLQEGAVRIIYHDFRHSFSLWKNLFSSSIDRLYFTHQNAYERNRAIALF
ncbi:hypothetical protein PCANC_17397 [Puccinia coronata f. sp. avenae]|uniref:Uncharacterized protein n=1 Tax=Puccinia coronata f. sp. avenae TaxID=200324 RepID=A0A2N5SCL1_9BASI|nr:hypothetical protein PCANC_17397 [Puccinia coronata f. sp. avenae]